MPVHLGQRLTAMEAPTLRVPVAAQRVFRRVLAALVAGLSFGHFAWVAVIVAPMGRLTARRLLDLDAEQSIGTWFSVVLLASCAVMALGVWLVRRQPAWLVVGGVALVCSMDEQVGTHEATIRLSERAGLGHTWVAFGAMLIVLASPLLLWCYRALGSPVNRRIFGAWALYGGATMGVELVEAVLFERGGTLWEMTLLYGVQESLELTASAILLMVIVAEFLGTVDARRLRSIISSR